jgi:DnaJ-class molecular chaperone
MWCPHCNGYGSSLREENERCVRCNGTGLVAADRATEAAQPTQPSTPASD